jgi:surface protein
VNPYSGRNAPLLKNVRGGRAPVSASGFPVVGNGLPGLPVRRDPQDDPDMVLVVDTTLPSATQTVTLPFAGTVNCVVDWGDNVQEAFTTTGDKTHTYAAVGEYTIRISGTLTAFGANVSRPEYKKLIAPGRSPFRTSWAAGFRSAANIVEFPSRMVDANVTTMANMFQSATNADPDTSGWNTAKVTNMANMFQSATNADPDTSEWDTGNVTTMSNMFSATNADPDTSGWNTAKVTTMASMFQSATNADPDTSGWDTANVTIMSSMFNSATNADPDTSGWNTAKVTNMASMFRFAANATPDTSGWNTSNVTTMTSMFWSATNADPDLSGFALNTGLTTMDLMLTGSGISILNYSRALVRFANQVFLNHGPYNVPFGAGPKYHATTHGDITGQYDNAPAARAFLAGAFAVTISGATDTDANGEYTLDEGTLTNDNSWTLTFATDTWTLKDDAAADQASGTGNARSPATVETWTGTEDGITVIQTGAGWTVTDGGAE